MSGGSWDYVYCRLSDAIEKLSLDDDPLRRKFGRHLKKVQKALHDIEWVDSSDCCPGDEVEAIEAVLNEHFQYFGKKMSELKRGNDEKVQKKTSCN